MLDLMKDAEYLARLIEKEAIKCLKAITVAPVEGGGFKFSVTHFRTEQVDDVELLECFVESVADCKSYAKKLIALHVSNYPDSKKTADLWAKSISKLSDSMPSASVYCPGLPWSADPNVSSP